MTLGRIGQWMLFAVGTVGALMTAWLTLSLAGHSLTAPAGGDRTVLLFFAAVCGALGLASLAGVALGFRLLRKGRWIAMTLILALAALPVPAAVVIAAKVIGPLPYDEQGRLIR